MLSRITSDLLLSQKLKEVICVEDVEVDALWVFTTRLLQSLCRYLWFECPTPANSSSRNWCPWVLHLVWWVFSLKRAFFLNYETQVLRFCFILYTLHSKLQFYSSAVCCSKVCLFPVNRIKICNRACEWIYLCICERSVQANWDSKKKGVKRDWLVS